MNKNICKLFIGGLAFFGLAFFVSGASAQEAQQSDQQNQEPIVDLIATVGVYNAKIISQDKNNFKISFDLHNQIGVQPQVKYAVALAKLVDGRAVPVYEKVYDDVVDLGPNELVNKVVDYSTPAYLNGKYQIWINSANTKGFPFGSTVIGQEIILNGDNQYVEILSDSCFVTVIDDSSGKKYAIGDGVDISGNEKLKVTCDVVNHFSKLVNLTPKFKTQARTLFGDIVADNNESQPKLSLIANEKKMLYFILPKAEKPQAYDAVLSFADENGRTISNSVAFHYVLRGAGATVQNIRLEKDYYAKGEIAKVAVRMTQSADLFFGSRAGEGTNVDQYALQISIKNSDGKSCSGNFFRKLGENDYPEIKSDIPITDDCVNPSIVVAATDEKGNIFDQNEFKVHSKSNYSVSAKQDMVIESKSNGYKMIKLAVLALIIIGLIASVYFISRKRAIGIKTILFLLILGGMFLTENRASALTYSICLPQGTAGGANGAFALCGARNIQLQYNLDTYDPVQEKASYSTGQIMTATSKFSSSDCANNWTGYGGVSLKIPTHDTIQIVPFLRQDGIGWYSAAKSAPTAPGNYDATFTFLYSLGSKELKFYGAGDQNNFEYKTCSQIRALYGASNIVSCDEKTETDYYYYTTCGDGCSNVHVGKYDPRYFFNRTVCGDGCETYLAYSIDGIDGMGSGKSIPIVTQETVKTTTYSILYQYPINMPFSVKSPAVNGACGSANGGSFATAPNTNLCSVGVPSVVSGTGPWTWTCNGANGGNNASCDANLSADINLFTAAPTNIAAGNSSTLTWNVTGASSCAATGGWTGAKSNTGGTELVSPLATTAYNLECWNLVGVSSGVKTATVTVNPAPAPNVTFSAAPNPIAAGNSSTLTWNVTGAKNCTATGGWTGAKSNTGGTQSVSPLITTTYNLECWSVSDISSGLKSVTLGVVNCDGTYTKDCGWTACDKTCGGGQQQKVCQSTLGAVCGSKIMDTQSCNTQSCPGADANWQETAP